MALQSPSISLDSPEDKRPEDLWIGLSLLAVTYVSVLSPSLVKRCTSLMSISALFLEQSMPDDGIIRASLRLVKDSSASLADEVVSLYRRIVEMMFTCESLFAVVSEPLSPLLRRCIEWDERFPDTVTPLTVVLQRSHSVSSYHIVLDLLSHLSQQKTTHGTSLLDTMPEIGLTLINYTSVWATLLSPYYHKGKNENYSTHTIINLFLVLDFVT